MAVEEVGPEGLRLASRLAGSALALPVVAGYVALGAGVLVGRSFLEVARQTWARVPSLGGTQRDRGPREPKAA